MRLFRGARLALGVAAAFSGAAALVDQVLWARLLGLALGHTVEGMATVLAVFMAGLGLGSGLAAKVLGSRRVGRWSYPAVETGIAFSALAVPPLVSAFDGPLGPLYDAGAASTLALARTAIAAAVLLVPTTLMGAALPLLGALTGEKGAGTGEAAGWLYAANTLGALVGCLATPLLLLPSLGTSRSLLVAASGNIAAAVIVAAWARPVGASPTPGQRTTAGPTLTAARVAVAVVAASGLSALAHEVAWTRTVALLIGPTPHALAFVVAAVVAGIGIGSATAGRFAARTASPLRALAWVQLAAALASLLVMAVAGRLPVAVGELVRADADRPDRLLVHELAGVFALLLVPSLLFGATFPFVVAALGRSGDGIGRAVGRALAWNTAGGVAGSLLAGFVGLPFLGLERTLRGAAVVPALAAAGAGVSTGRGKAVVAASLALAGAAALMPAWDRELMTGGAYRYAVRAEAGDVEEDLRAGEIVFDREGRGVTVTVRRLGSTLGLAIDGKVDASNGGDLLTQRLLAHVPLVLHPAPRRVCVIGLGSGVTVGSALLYPLEGLDVAEISPEVIAASELFRPWNHGALSDPRVRLLVADGRNHLRLTSRRYDVIVSEPSNPWMAGMATLFTREAFAEARGRLAAGGLFAQWVHLYGMAPADLRLIVAGFTDVFPRSTLFVLGEGDAILVGGEAAWRAPTAEQLRHRVASAGGSEELRAIGIASPAVFGSLFAVEGDTLRAWATTAERHTDDRPLLELRAPRAMLADTAQENLASLLAAGRGGPWPEPWSSLVRGATAHDIAARAGMLERGGSPVWAFLVARDAHRRDPGDAAARESVVRLALAVGGGDEAESDLRAVLPGPDETGTRTALAALLAAEGRSEEAGRELTAALARDSRYVPALLQAAEIQARLGQPEAAMLLAGRASALAPGSARARALVASALLAQGRDAEAQAEVERALALDPENAVALALATSLRLAARDLDGAKRLAERLIAADADDPRAHALLGRIEQQRGQGREAAAAFERAAELAPGTASSVYGPDGRRR